jgi:hypothetical protein
VATTAPDTILLPLLSPSLTMTLSVPCARSLDAVGSPAAMFSTLQAQPSGMCALEQSLSPAHPRVACPSPSFNTVSPSISPSVSPSRAMTLSSPSPPAISPLPRALTLAVRDQPCLSPSENLLTPQLPPVPASCFPLSSPEHSYTSLQTNLSCARGGVSTEEPKAGDADADTVGN